MVKFYVQKSSLDHRNSFRSEIFSKTKGFNSANNGSILTILDFLKKFWKKFFTFSFLRECQRNISVQILRENQNARKHFSRINCYSINCKYSLLTPMFVTIQNKIMWYFRKYHPELDVKTQTDCISISKVDKKIEVDPNLPLLVNTWLRKLLVDYFRLFSK